MTSLDWHNAAYHQRTLLQACVSTTGANLVSVDRVLCLTLRYRSKRGTSRATFKKEDDLATVHQAISAGLAGIDATAIEVADKPSGPYQLFSKLHGQSIQDVGMKHGDMLFLRFAEPGTAEDASISKDPAATSFSSANKLSGASVQLPATTKPTASLKSSDAWKDVRQHPVDDILEKQSGKIPRSRDNKMCKHGLKGMCDYCMPLEPFDSTYLQEHKIKHSSFHAHLKKINSATNKPELNASFIPPLNEPIVKVNTHCTTGHAPWPKGICSKCQPSAITLQSQEFRMVDHIEFANSTIIDSFLNFWRKSGSQRFGYLYGTYDVYDAVPLGQKAVVEAIYEPPQNNQADGLELLEWEEEANIDRIAGLCGLHKLGIIFTDLTDDGSGKGTVLAKRHIDSFFLSSLEASLSASFQATHPNKTHWSASGTFGSKFVTAVVTGSIEGQIEITSYQISEQGVAMFDAKIIEPSVDPNTILVCPEGNDAYIPEVFYSKINEYGRQVKENAKPAFPMEYLLITLTHGFPNDPKPRFASTSFPIENRAVVGEAGDLKAIAKQLNLGSETTIAAISDFHLLLYIVSLDILSSEEVTLLAKVATTEDSEAGAALVGSDGWQTLLAILNESGGMLDSGSSKRAIADDGSVNTFDGSGKGTGGQDNNEKWLLKFSIQAFVVA